MGVLDMFYLPLRRPIDESKERSVEVTLPDDPHEPCIVEGVWFGGGATSVMPG